MRLFVLAFFFSNSLWAQKLFFPVEKNHVQIFPQRFEYSLLDQDRLQVGDILIDSANIRFRLVAADKDKTHFRFHFTWPANLLTEGELIVKDNTGKALWAEKFKRHQIQLTDVTEPEGSRSDLASFQSGTVTDEVLNKLQLLPFFKFCAVLNDQQTHIYVCSKDLFLKKEDKTWRVQWRESFRKDSYVEINGRPVDPQGVIFLTETTETISMRALIASGATLEIDTRKKNVRFKDIVLAPNKREVIIRATGTSPVNEANVKKFGLQDWETSLPIDRPVMYLKGEGDIPMRQEFLVSGPVRGDDLQVEVTKGWCEKTYSSEVTLGLKSNKPLAFENIDKQSTLDRNRAEWKLANLDKGKMNTRYLGVELNKEKFIAGHDVFRGFPFSAEVRLMVPLYLQTTFRWWLNDHRSGLELGYDRALAKAASDPDWSVSHLAYLLRMTPGLHLIDSTWGLAASYDSISTGSTIATAAAGAFIEWKMAPHWIRARLSIPLLATGASASLKSSWDGEISGRYFTNQNMFYDLGARVFQYRFQTDTAGLGLTRSLLFGGIGSQF